MRLQFSHQLLSCLRISVDDHRLSTLPGNRARDGRSNPLCTTGDQHDLVPKIQIHS
jgi:hypothetical protein